MSDNLSKNKQADDNNEVDIINNDNNVINKQEAINKENKNENNKETNKETNIITTKENIIYIKEEKKSFKINGQSLNIKIFLDKNLEESVSTMSLNGSFNTQNNLNFINFVINKLIIDDAKNNQNLYDKIELTFNNIENNKIYSIIKLIEDLEPTQIFFGENEELNMNLNFALNLFICPKIIKPIIDYYECISGIFKNKEQIQMNDDIEMSNDNENLNNIDNNVKYNLNINSIKIILIENDNYENIIFNNNINNNLNEIPQNIILYEENNNYISLNLNKINFTIEKNKTTTQFNFTMKSLIIQDNIYNSKYKIMFSNYDFKNQNETFITCALNMSLNNNMKKFEIKPQIKIAPLAIYLDQVSLYFILDILNKLKNKDENKINEDNNNIIQNNDNSKYVISSIDIKNFFIELNYNTNNAAKEYTIIANQITSLFNTTSINKLKIIFQNYTTDNNNCLKIKEAIKNIYEFYSNDMIKQISGSIISALPLFYHIYDSIDGIFDIVREPLDSYDKNKSVIDGLVQGVDSWVVKTATMFTYLGENIGNIFSFKGCVGNADKDLHKEESGICRQLRHSFNEDNKEKEEYYLKW